MFKKILTMGLVSIAPKLAEEAYEFGLNLAKDTAKCFQDAFSETEPKAITRKPVDRTKLTDEVILDIKDTYKDFCIHGAFYTKNGTLITICKTKKCLVYLLNKKHSLNKTLKQYKRVWNS